MFNILNPWFFLGFFLVGIPIIIHYINYKKIKIIDFAAVSFLYDLQKKKISQYSLQNLILLILRCLIILLLVLCFTFPQYILGYTGFMNNSSIIFLVDTSASMKYKTSKKDLFSEMKNKTIELINNLTGKEEFTIITTNPNKALFQTFISNKKIAVSKIKELKCSYNSANFNNSINLCEKFFKNSDQKNKELCILSDLSKTSFSNSMLDSLTKKGVKIKYISYSPKILTNVAITKLNVLTTPIIKKELTFSVYLNNFSSHNIQDINIDFSVDNRIYKRKIVSIKSFKQKIVNFSYIFEKAGIHKIKAIINEDKLDDDNVFNYSVIVRPAIHPLIIAEINSTNSFFISYAMNPAYSSLNSIIPTIVTEKQIPNIITNYDMMILCSAEKINSNISNCANKFIYENKPVLTMLWKDYPIEKYNEFLKKIDFSAEIKHNVSAYSTKSYKLKVNNRKNFFSFLDKKNALFKNVSFTEFGLLKENKLDNLAYFNEDFPAIVLNKEKNIMMYCFSFDKTQTDIAITKYFVPLIHESIYSLIKTNNSINVNIGEEFKLEIPFKFYLENKNITIIKPDNKKIVVSIEKKDNKYFCSYIPKIPGIYILPEINRSFNVNVNGLVEGDLRKVKFSNKMQNNIISKTKTYSAHPDIIILSRYLAFFILLLSLFELYYSNRKRKFE